MQDKEQLECLSAEMKNPALVVPVNHSDIKKLLLAFAPVKPAKIGLAFWRYVVVMMPNLIDNFIVDNSLND